MFMVTWVAMPFQNQHASPADKEGLSAAWHGINIDEEKRLRYQCLVISAVFVLSLVIMSQIPDLNC